MTNLLLNMEFLLTRLALPKAQQITSKYILVVASLPQREGEMKFKIPKYLWAAVISHNLPAMEAEMAKGDEKAKRCKHEWLEKPGYGERQCPKCNKIEKIPTKEGQRNEVIDRGSI